MRKIKNSISLLLVLFVSILSVLLFTSCSDTNPPIENTPGTTAPIDEKQLAEVEKFATNYMNALFEEDFEAVYVNTNFYEYPYITKNTLESYLNSDAFKVLATLENPKVTDATATFKSDYFEVCLNISSDGSDEIQSVYLNVRDRAGNKNYLVDAEAFGVEYIEINIPLGTQLMINAKKVTPISDDGYYKIDNCPAENTLIRVVDPYDSTLLAKIKVMPSKGMVINFNKDYESEVITQPEEKE